MEDDEDEASRPLPEEPTTVEEAKEILHRFCFKRGIYNDDDRAAFAHMPEYHQKMVLETGKENQRELGAAIQQYAARSRLQSATNRRFPDIPSFTALDFDSSTR